VRVVAFGTYDKQKHPRVAVLLEGLRDHDVDVDECNEPLALDTADRVRVLQRPWLLPGLLLRVLSRWARLARRIGGHLPADVVLVGYLGHFDVLLARALCRRRYRVVLDHLVSAYDTAVDRGSRNRMVLWALRLLDIVAVSCADIVIVDTDESADLVAERFRDRVVVVPVGAPTAWFESRQEGEPGSGPLRAVFFGTFTPLQGAVVVAEASRLVDPQRVSLSLIGSGQDEVEVRRRASAAVRWNPWMSTQALVSEVAAHDVCLGIFGTSGKAARVVPNKVFQGAAAGCVIVTSDTPPQRRAFGEVGVFVPAGDPTALANALTGLAEDRQRTELLRAATARRATEAFTPASVVTALLDALDVARPAARRRRSDESPACSLP
jgi:glycosyltransferase involved in cell wall biosynthesis